MASRVGRGVRDPQPLQRTRRDTPPALHRPGDDRAVPSLRRRAGLPLRISPAAEPDLFRDPRGAHAVRHAGRHDGVVDSRRLRYAGVRLHPLTAVGDSLPDEGCHHGQPLADLVFADRRADSPAAENRRRSLHQPPRSGAGGLSLHAPKPRRQKFCFRVVADARFAGRQGLPARRRGAR